MKRFVGRSPVLFGTVVSLVGVLAMLWPVWIRGLPTPTQILLSRAGECLVAASLLTMLGWWRDAGFVMLRSWRGLIPYTPLGLVVLLVVLLVVIIPGAQVHQPELFLFAAASFLSGAFAEEALYRGVLLRAFLPRGMLRASLCSATIFSLVHLANLLIGQDLAATMLQLLRAFLLGFAFSAVAVYTRNLWPLVLLHASINFAGFLGSGSLVLVAKASPKVADVLVELIVFGLLSAFGFWLIRRAERQFAEQAAPKEKRFAKLSDYPGMRL